MLTLGPITFLAPLALLGLAVLPLLWWLMRLIPPAPRRVRFPAIRLIMRLVNPEESAAKTPLWLVLLRITLALAIILGAAHPVINAVKAVPGTGSLVIAVDDGWAAARDWSQRKALLTGLIGQAGREGRAVALVSTAPGIIGGHRPSGSLLSAEQALEAALALQPKPWPVDRAQAARLVGGLKLQSVGKVVWLSNGLEDAGTAELARALARMGPLTVFAAEPGTLPAQLLPLAADRKGLTIAAARAAATGIRTLGVKALSEDGRILAKRALTFHAGEIKGEARLELPAEMRNRLTRIEIENGNSAAATLLIDERWRRRPVGLITGDGRSADQPLLNELYYLNRALDPFTEVRKGSVAELMKRELALMVLTDSSAMDKPTRAKVEKWLSDGGILLRFAGPRLAATKDALLPVRLRAGDRELGGALSWTRPAALAPFVQESPFAGIGIPKDVKVRRQVLAQPTIDLPARTWARLADGTPLITAEKRGKGWLVLVHTTASPAWSNLPLSGLFVKILRRLIRLSRGVADRTGRKPLPPITTLDGFGRLGSPLPGTTALANTKIASKRPGPLHPPGFYGNEAARRAFNLAPTLGIPEPLGALPAGVERLPYLSKRETDFRPWLLLAALLLAITDMIASLGLRGFLRFARGVVVAVALAIPPAAAQEKHGDALPLAATLKLRLAYVETGNREVDRATRAGLEGLSLIANLRTAAEMAEPMAVDPARDELAFFPLIYWPITEDTPIIDEAAAARINAYLKRGGTILFDTRDEGTGGLAGGRLRDIARRLDIPPLSVLPADHVLTRSYYLLREFPGRWTDGQVWVERRDARINDGVSSVIVGSHDWAGAWAVDEDHRPLYPAVPGGARQREMAYRFGVNLLMYVLTGNYKTDQVHLPAILERLGQ